MYCIAVFDTVAIRQWSWQCSLQITDAACQYSAVPGTDCCTGYSPLYVGYRQHPRQQRCGQENPVRSADAGVVFFLLYKKPLYIALSRARTRTAVGIYSSGYVHVSHVPVFVSFFVVHVFIAKLVENWLVSLGPTPDEVWLGLFFLHESIRYTYNSSSRGQPFYKKTAFS